MSDQFIGGDIDQVILIFTEFVSIGTQKLAVRQFLPLESVETIAPKVAVVNSPQSSSSNRPLTVFSSRCFLDTSKVVSSLHCSIRLLQSMRTVSGQ